MNGTLVSKQEMFETMPVPKAIAAMAVPTIISQLVDLVYNMVDTFYIGMTGDAYKTASVTLSFTIFMMTISFANLFGIGGGSLMARLTGVGKTDAARKVSAFSFYGSIGIALVYSLFIGLLLNPILNLLGASPQTIEYARQYVWLVVIIGDVPVILSMTCAHLLRNAGYSKQASIGLSGGGILNILLDPLFMFVLLPHGMEVFGAALATLLSNIASCIYLVAVIRRESATSALSFRFQDAVSIGKSEMHGVFSVGIPSAILTGMFDVANIFLNFLMASHGDLELAAIGIVMKAERLPNAVNVGLCQGMLPLIAYNYSSGNWKRMNAVIGKVKLYGIIIAGASLVLFEIFSSGIVHLFLSTSVGNIAQSVLTISLAAVFLRLRCLASIPQFLNYSTSFCMQAVGDGRDTLIHAIVRQVVFYIPFMYLLNAFFGANGLAAALAIGETCSAVFAYALMERWKRKNLSVHESTSRGEPDIHA
jgi:Na+-driven multidrug efflux pump